MPRSLLAVTALLHAVLLPPLAAQTLLTGSASTLGYVTVQAGPFTNWLPPGSPLPDGTSLGAVHIGPGSVLDNVAVHLRIGLTNQPPNVSYSINEGVATSNPNLTGRAGPNETLLSLQSVVPGTCTLRVTYSTAGSSAGYTSAAVDIGNDGSDEWSSTSGTTWTTAFPLDGAIDVRTRTHLPTGNGGSHTLLVEASLEPDVLVDFGAASITPLQVWANGAYDSVSAGSRLENGAAISANMSVDSASTAVTFEEGTDALRFVIDEQATRGTPGSFVGTGQHEVLLELEAAAPARGVLEVVYERTLQSALTNVFAEAAIDVDNDGSIDWSAPPSPSSPSASTSIETWSTELELDGPTAIRTITRAAAGLPFYPSAALGKLTITFRTIAYGNGPLVTHPGAGAGGADVSSLQDGTLGLTELAFPCDTANGEALADDFVVCGPHAWLVDALEVPVLAGASSMASPTIDLAITANTWNGPVVHTASLPASVSAAGGVAYRTTSATVGSSTSHPITRLVAELAHPVVLEPGVYWLRYSVQGLYAANSAPPVSVLGVAATGNGLAIVGAVPSPLTSGGAPQAAAFRLFGTRLQERARFETTVPGCASARLEMRGNPTPGGVIRADIVNPPPSTSSYFGVGLTALPVPVPFCGCQIGNPLTVAFPGPSLEVLVPGNPSVCGAQLHVQGIVWEPGACPGVPISFTENIRALIR